MHRLSIFKLTQFPIPLQYRIITYDLTTPMSLAIEICTLIITITLFWIIFSIPINNIIFKFSFVPITIGKFYFSIAMHLTFIKITLVYYSIWIFIYSITLFYSFHEISDVLVALLVDLCAMAVGDAEFCHAGVFWTIGKFDYTHLLVLCGFLNLIDLWL